MSLIDAKNFDEVIKFSIQVNKLVVITRGEKGAIAIQGNNDVECGIQNNLKIVGINYKDQLSDAISYLEDNGDPYDNSIFDLGGDYSLKLGVIGAPEPFLVIDGKIVSHRV